VSSSTTSARTQVEPTPGTPIRSLLRPVLVTNLVLEIGIVVTGGLVRLTGSGLGCPTWPQCVPGSFTPVPHQEQGIHKLIEFGNRTLTSVVGIAAILVYLFNPGFAHPAMRVGLALMFGGAVGNLIDRLRTGEVVDFIKFPHFPAFNAADSAITIGVCFLLWAMLREPPKRPASE